MVSRLMLKKGVFITFEGGDGTGKSTQSELLAEWLDSYWPAGVVETWEPGGTKGGQAIRELTVKENDYGWDSLTEALLMTAARRDHVLKVIEPALAEGKAVISDRFYHSTIAYQGRGDAKVKPLIEKLTNNFLKGMQPDIVILLDLDPTIGLSRSWRGDNDEIHYENRGDEFQREVRNTFRQIAKKDLRFITIKIEETDDPDDIHERIIAELEPRLEKLI